MAGKTSPREHLERVVTHIAGKTAPPRPTRPNPPAVQARSSTPRTTPRPNAPAGARARAPRGAAPRGGARRAPPGGPLLQLPRKPRPHNLTGPPRTPGEHAEGLDVPPGLLERRVRLARGL